MRKSLIIACFVAFFGVVLNPCRAQDPFGGNFREFARLTIEDGLSSNNIYDVCTDRSGCIWMATTVGLARYDGMSVSKWFKEDLTVRSNYVNYVYCDSRNRLWIGTDNGIAIRDNESGKFTNLEVLTGMNIERETAWFYEDTGGTMWISFKRNGIVAVDMDSFSVKRYFYDTFSGRETYISRIWFQPEEGLFLVTLYEQGLYEADLEKETLEPFRRSEDGRECFAGKNIKGIIRTEDGSFFLSCTDGTLWNLEPGAHTCRQLTHSIPPEVRETRRIQLVAPGMLAVATSNGLYFYDLHSDRLFSDSDIRHYTAALRGKSVHCMIGNLEDGLILGFHLRGLAIQQDLGFRFSTVRLNAKEVSGFAEYNDTSLWVSTRQNGLYLYNPGTGHIRHLEDLPVPNQLEGIAMGEGYLWTWSESGVYRIHPEDLSVSSYREGGSDVLSLLSAPGSRISLLTREGVSRYQEEKDCFVEVPALHGHHIDGMAAAMDGKLILHSNSRGLLYDTGHAIRKAGPQIPSNPSSQNLADVICEDPLGRIWISPQSQGVYIVRGKDVKQLTSRSGLYSEMVSNLVSDNEGNLYISTDRSLSLLTGGGQLFTVTKSDGLLNFGFTRNANLCTARGDIYLGSRDGFLRIPPLRSSLPAPSRSLGQVRSKGETVPVKNGRINLAWNQNTFEVEAGLIDPHHLKSGQALYCLEGYDETWLPANSEGRLSFVRIPAGKYRLMAYGNEKPLLEVRVRPHPLRSPLAILLYLALGISLAGLFISYVLTSEKRKREANYMQMKIDLHKDKMDFFMGIAHEIKTPLTLITTPLNHILSQPDLDEETRFDLQVIDKNASYLTKLVKELMELSRIEDKKYLVNCTQIDLGDLLRNIEASFSEQTAPLGFRLDLPEEPLWVMADKAATMKICNNLMLNAVKHAKRLLEVGVSCLDGNALVTFRNDGPVIPVDMREKIFETFTQYKYTETPQQESDGFGIGLSVARALATLQGGSLVLSERTDLNEFVLSLPLAEVLPASPAEEPDETDAAGKKTILVVEDHADLLSYLEKTFSPRFHILKASNGEEAFRIICSKENIDLVVTDIRMGVMNGIELCRAIKNDITYSHIPVLILSANLTPEMRITALEEGADAMVEKPFSVEELLSAIDNIFASRRRLLQQAAAHRPVSENAPAGRSFREAVFLENLDKAISENMTDPEFSVETLADELGMSQSSLNRKIRDIFRTTTNAFIRDRRLEKAESLLKTTSLQINEICYKVGFQTPSYFIKCFRTKYGCSPNEYAKARPATH